MCLLRKCQNFKICFSKKFLERTCRKSWTFTRVPQFEFIGDANEEVNNVQVKILTI